MKIRNEVYGNTDHTECKTFPYTGPSVKS